MKAQKDKIAKHSWNLHTIKCEAGKPEEIKLVRHQDQNMKGFQCQTSYFRFSSEGKGEKLKNSEERA